MFEMQHHRTVLIYFIVCGTRMSTMLAGDIILYVDLSKLSNLGTYQEIGKSYDATKRNFISKIFFLVLRLTVNKRLSKIY